MTMPYTGAVGTQPKRRTLLGQPATAPGTSAPVAPTLTPTPNVNVQQATPQPAQPAVGAQTSAGSFGASNNLISSQFSPTASARTQGAQGMTDVAAQNVANGVPQTFARVGMQDMSDDLGQRAYSALTGMFGGGGGGGGAGGAGFGYGADTKEARELAMGQLRTTLGTTPDRATLASNAFTRLLDESTPQFEADLRATNARNAAMGRRGSGMATQDLGTVQQRREEALMRERGRLADDAAGLSLADQQAKLGAAQGLMGALGGMDTSAGSLSLQGAALANSAANANFDRMYGLYRDAYGNQVSERDKGADFGQTRFQNQRQVLGDMSAYEDMLTGNDRADRNELRNERGYQYGLSRDAQGDRIDQFRAQEDVFGNDFDRAARMTSMGYGMDPSDAYAAAATRRDGAAQGAMSAGADLLGTWGQRRAQNGASAPPALGIPLPEVNLPMPNVDPYADPWAALLRGGL